MLTGTSCTCGGTNENCYKCYGTGIDSRKRDNARDKVASANSSKKRLAKKPHHVSSGIKDTLCSVCGKKLRGELGLATHTRVQHPEVAVAEKSKSKTTCPICK